MRKLPIWGLFALALSLALVACAGPALAGTPPGCWPRRQPAPSPAPAPAPPPNTIVVIPGLNAEQPLTASQAAAVQQYADAHREQGLVLGLAVGAVVGMVGGLMVERMLNRSRAS